MRGPFIGSDALGRRTLTRGQLRWLAKDQPLTLRAKTVAAWLWSDRQAIVAGRAAAALHGALWIDETVATITVSAPPMFTTSVGAS